DKCEIEDYKDSFEKCESVYVNEYSYTFFWKKENPQHIYLECDIPNYEIISPKVKKDEFKEDYENLITELKKYNTFIENTEYNTMPQLFVNIKVPIENLKNMSKICSLVAKYSCEVYSYEINC
ncbi:hypothetical protein, partial [Gemella morbillorum]